MLSSLIQSNSNFILIYFYKETFIFQYYLTFSDFMKCKKNIFPTKTESYDASDE